MRRLLHHHITQMGMILLDLLGLRVWRTYSFANRMALVRNIVAATACLWHMVSIDFEEATAPIRILLVGLAHLLKRLILVPCGV